MIRWLLDLAAVALLALLAGAAMVSFDGFLRAALVLPMILFVPGYAFLSALFPEESSLSQSRRSRRPWSAAEQANRENTDETFLLGNIERLGLSVALSLALVSLIVFGLNFTVGFDARRIGLMLLVFTGSMIIFAIARRIVLPPEERYTIEFSGNTPMGTTFMGMFALSLLVLAASVGGFVVMSPAEQSTSEFFVVAENESTGNTSIPAADDAIVNGQPATFIVNNSEGSTQSYSIVAVSQTVEGGEVTGSETVETFNPTVKDGGSKQIEFEPPEEGDRLIIYFYKGSAPDDPSRGSADKTLRYYLSSNGSDGGDESIAPPRRAIHQSPAALERR